MVISGCQPPNRKYISGLLFLQTPYKFEPLADSDIGVVEVHEGSPEQEG